jgi:hypothetical protein
MPRRNNIRVKDKDLELIRDINKRVGKKKSNIYTRYRQRLEIQTKSIEEFSTRAELKQYIKEMGSFLDPKNPEYRFTRTDRGVTLRQDTQKEIQKIIKKVNKTKDKQFEKYKHLPFLVEGKPSDMTVAMYHEIVKKRTFEEFRHLSYNPGRFRSEYEAQIYLQDLKKMFRGNWWQRQAKEYKENYIKGLKKQYAGIPQLPQLVKLVENMSLKQLLHYHYTTDEGRLKYMYEPAETLQLFNRTFELFKNGGQASGQ